jgi:hypothetical protein
LNLLDDASAEHKTASSGDTSEVGHVNGKRLLPDLEVCAR